MLGVLIKWGLDYRYLMLDRRLFQQQTTNNKRFRVKKKEPLK